MMKSIDDWWWLVSNGQVSSGASFRSIGLRWVAARSAVLCRAVLSRHACRAGCVVVRVGAVSREGFVFCFDDSWWLARTLARSPAGWLVGWL